ncbi:MAG: TonB-dependent receptor, partial [Pseudomonadota bacterium]
KIEAYGAFDYRLTDDTIVGLEVSYADIETTRGNSPSFPVLTQPIVPTTHPDNIFGADVGYFGRIQGNGAPRFDTPHTSETWRIAADIQGRVGEDYDWTLSYVYAGNDHQQIIEDVVADRLVNALNGLGGGDCNPMMGVPGQGACQYFNPFATSFTTSPNDPTLLDFLVESQVRGGQARAHVVDALLTGPWFTLPGGKAEFALGAQYRVDEFRLDYDEFSNNDAFAFLIGNPDSEGDIGVASLFGEIVLPLTETLTAQAALRYEAYDKDIGDTLDPKIALAWQPTDLFKLRGSYATSFRAPSVSQTAGISTILNQASDPVTGTTSFVANRTLGNEALQPETAKNYTLGALWTPVPKLNLTIDYWNIQVEDVIVQENFQAVLDAFAQDTSRVVRAGDPLNGPVVQINTTRVNATSLDTSGVDIAIDYEVDLWNGVFRPQMEANYVAEYEIEDPQLGFVDGVGSRNFRNIG